MAEAATPAAAPAAAPEPAAPANPQEASEHAALLAELEGEFDAPEPVPSKRRSEPNNAKPKAGDEAEGAEVLAGGDDLEEETEADDQGEVEPEGGEDFRAHVKSLTEAGDLRKLEEYLGLEKGALKIDGSKFRYLRQRQEKADKAVADATRQRDEATTLVQRAQEEYGPMVRAKQAFAAGTAQGVQQAGRFVEKHFGCSLAQFVDAVVKAGRGEASAPRAPIQDQAIEELRAEVARLKQEREQTSRAETEKAAAERHVTAIKGKLTGSPIAVLPDAAQLVYAKLKGSYDSAIDGYKLTLREAIAEVAADPATKWRLHERAQKARRTAEPEPEPSRPGRRGQPPARRPAAKTMTEAEERQALIAELEAEARKEERATRYGKR